jgi:hypothetical protein
VKKVFFSLVTVLMGLAVAWGIAEMAVKGYTPQLTGEVVYGYHKELGAIPLPHQRGRKTPPEGPSYDFSHDSYGFRGAKEYRGPKTAPRVLFLGDSYTYGVGVNDDQAFPHQVEAILNAKGYAAEMINAGNPGKGTDYELKLLQTLGPALKPDLVVVCFYWNDFSDNNEGEYFRLGKNGELIPKKPHSLTAKKAWVENLPVIRWLLSWSHAANLVKVSIIDLLRSPSKAAAKLKYQPEAPKPDIKMTQMIISQLIKTAKVQGSDILFFYLPDEPQVDQYRKSGQISRYEQDFISLVKAQNAEPYSLTAAMTAVQGRIALQYWGHWSPAAHLIAAKYMSGPIEARLQKKSN